MPSAQRRRQSSRKRRQTQPHADVYLRRAVDYACVRAELLQALLAAAGRNRHAALHAADLCVCRLFFLGRATAISRRLRSRCSEVGAGDLLVHRVQFVLDYFVAFTLLGTAAFFPKNLPLGAAVAGFLRMMASNLFRRGFLWLLCGGIRVQQPLGLLADLQFWYDIVLSPHLGEICIAFEIKTRYVIRIRRWSQILSKLLKEG